VTKLLGGVCCIVCFSLLQAGFAPASAPSLPGFRMQEIETGLKVGYAVSLTDVNHDGKPDIVVVDTTRVVWYENPSWQRHTIIEGVTKPDNVCIAPYDIDGDGLVDFALGAHWKPFEPAGTLQWLKRGKSLDQPWSVFPIDTEPSIHRVRFADIDGDGKAELLSVPLMGPGAKPDKNWLNAALRVTAYRIPKDPTRDRWIPEILSQELHVAHNFWPIPAQGRKGMDVLVASYEGVNLLTLNQGKWKARHLGTGNQEKPEGKRGASEIKQGTLKSGKKFIATIEPWHGDQIVVYSEPAAAGELWQRHVLDEDLKWGHAVWCADLDGDGSDELIIGIRDDPGPKDKAKGRRGIRIFKAQDEAGRTWARTVLEAGGVAVEDLQAADLDGDGKIDIVAVGRQTHNARIYWNLGSKK